MLENKLFSRLIWQKIIIIKGNDMKKLKEKTRDKSIQIRLTEEELKALQEAKDVLNNSVSRVLRD